MPRKRFDKKNAQTFSVVHRSHEDLLYFDNDASKHVLVPAAQRAQAQGTLSQLKARKSGKQSYSTQELEDTLGKDAVQAMRANEGLAAQYGIYFDDSQYDYMQHLKPIGGGGDSVFIEAKNKEKPKELIEALIKDVLPSETKRKVAFDDEENIPEELRGFQPHMDPRLREVLEALEDEAYVAEAGEGEVEDADFLDLLQSGEVADEDDFYDEYDGDDWDLDEFEDYEGEYDEEEVVEELENPYNEGEAPEDVEAAVPAVSSGWEKDFMKFKKETKNAVNEWDSDNEFEEEEEEDVVGELPQIGSGKKKLKNKMRKKMGAMTDTSSFSMSSSALFRTEGLTLLDDRYEQLNRKFEEEDPYMEEHQAFDMANERPDFEDMLDDFLDNYELDRGGRKLVKKDQEHETLKAAADSVSKGKLAARRKREKNSMDKLGGAFGNMKI